MSGVPHTGPPVTVFVDRDGTINRKPADGNYVQSPDEFAFLPGAEDALRLLNHYASRTIIVTNQRGVALGRMTERDLDEIHHRMLADLARVDAHVDAIYYCPHDLGECSCRKPGVGLFLQAKHEHPDIAFQGSIMIGDSMADMRAAARLGLRSVLVSRSPLAGPSAQVSHRATSLLDAARWIAGLR